MSGSLLRGRLARRTLAQNDLDHGQHSLPGRGTHKVTLLSEQHHALGRILDCVLPIELDDQRCGLPQARLALFHSPNSDIVCLIHEDFQ
jgi:hypothetical protein